jgi:hypothetical protein
MPKRFSEIVDRLTEYVEVKIELLKLNLLTRLSKVLASVISVGIITGLLFFFLFFLGFGIAELLNELLSSQFWGFIIVAGIFLLLILIIFRLLSSNKIQDWIEKAILDSTENDSDSE